MRVEPVPEDRTAARSFFSKTLDALAVEPDEAFTRTNAIAAEVTRFASRTTSH